MVEDLPVVIASAVVRSTHQGESHGGLFLVDLATGHREQVIDWNDQTISWEGRGADRGLRGIAFHRDLMLIAASDELFVYDQTFQKLDSFRNRYLKHCHEISVVGSQCFLTSTGFDSILIFDLLRGIFTEGYWFRTGATAKLRRKFGLGPNLELRGFDPETAGGPPPLDHLHLNSVFPDGNKLFVSGTRLSRVLVIDEQGLGTYSRIPYGSHNARPFRQGSIFNHTASDRIVYALRDGRIKESYRVHRYPEAELINVSLPKDHARAGFARGLCLAGDLIIGGSSPATISVYKSGSANPVRHVNLTLDVRNAIHGLELWPY